MRYRTDDDDTDYRRVANVIDHDRQIIYLYDHIDRYTAVAISNFLDNIKDERVPIQIKINSTGGDLHDVQAICADLSGFQGKIFVDITNCAFSGAAMVALAGNHIIMYRGGQMMLHYAHWEEGDGSGAEHRKNADTTDKHFERQIKLILSRSDLTVKELKTRTRNGFDDLFLDPEECLKLKLVDELYG